MEMMPQPQLEPLTSSPLVEVPATTAPVPLPTFGPDLARHWRDGLPTLAGTRCTLRDLRLEDAPSLCAHLTTEEVARFISPPPSSVEGFEDFIRWAHRRRAQGRYACFAIVPAGGTHAVGMFQVRIPEADPATVEWGFVLGSAFWGTGIFVEGAQKVIEFVFRVLGVERLEARSVLQNGRGNGALKKVGARREMVLRGSFERLGERFDQNLWVLTRAGWLAARRAWRVTVH